MSARELTALGTASLVPTKTRNHNGYFLRWGASGLLFDPGEGTQRQLTQAGISVRAIHVICLTHLHGDHCLGLPGVLQRLSLDQVPHEVTICYPAVGQEYVDHLRHASSYYNQAQLRFLPVPGSEAPREILRTADFVLSTASLDHRVPTVGYRVADPPGRRLDKAELERRGLAGPQVGQLVRDGQLTVAGVTHRLADVSVPRRATTFAFVMDTRPCAAAAALAADADLLVMEATYTQECAHLAAEHAHSTAAQAAEVAVSAGARRLALTHFSARYPDTAGHVAEASALHSDVVALADLERVPVR